MHKKQKIQLQIRHAINEHNRCAEGNWLPLQELTISFKSTLPSFVIFMSPDPETNLNINKNPFSFCTQNASDLSIHYILLVESH